MWEDFRESPWGNYPVQGSGGAKAPYRVSHEAKIACPNCSFEGPLEEYYVLNRVLTRRNLKSRCQPFIMTFIFWSLLRLLSLFSLY